jgi:glyoxylase-like metal-dependent hydrolase (beta-lactamase superfamily II)
MKLSSRLHAFVWQSMTANNCNTYLIDGPTRVLIDPGHLRLFDHVEKGLADIGLAADDIGLVICTHAHPDHMESIQAFQDTPTLIAIHEKEWQMAKSMGKHLEAALGVSIDAFSPDFFLADGDLSVHGLGLQVFHTPGHSPGSVSLYWPEEKALFTGDLIFKDGLGRTDLPGGSGAQLKESIQALSGLDARYLLSGHGEIISSETEVKRNFDHVQQVWFNYI